MRVLLLACAFVATNVHARSFTVTANADMTFSPAQIEIYQGDSIHFVNNGGLHNVRADDGTFTCALDCNLHNAPSSLPWQVSVRFNRLGTIGYYCDQHGDLTSGMRGSVTVIDRILVAGFEKVFLPE